MLGHPTGRLLLARDGYAVDLDAVIAAAAESGTMIEINANPHRLDLDDVHCPKGRRPPGFTIAINPDAHAVLGPGRPRFTASTSPGRAGLGAGRRLQRARDRRRWTEILHSSTSRIVGPDASRRSGPRRPFPCEWRGVVPIMHCV